MYHQCSKNSSLVHVLIISIALFAMIEAANNGVGKTPPMGWSTWNFFRCNISEDLILETAKAMVSSGMKGKQLKNIF